MNEASLPDHKSSSLTGDGNDKNNGSPRRVNSHDKRINQATCSSNEDVVSSHQATPPKINEPFAGTVDSGKTEEIPNRENTLIEAFPSLDTKVIRAVLRASNGNVERAFNALLELSDPTCNERPEIDESHKTLRSEIEQHSQVEADELYARQLHQYYQSEDLASRTARRPDQAAILRQNSDGQNPSRRNGQHHDKEYSFLEDDVPVIKENIKKGFQEVQSIFSRFVSDVKQKLETVTDDLSTNHDNPNHDNNGHHQPQSQLQSSKISPGSRKFLNSVSSQSKSHGRRSGSGSHINNYDADPQLLSDDLTHFNNSQVDDTVIASLYESPRPSDPSLTSNPPNSLPKKINPRPRTSLPAANSMKPSKWQPIASVPLNPDLTERNPFSLGDSDEETDQNRSDSFPSNQSPPLTINQSEANQHENLPPVPLKNIAKSSN